MDDKFVARMQERFQLEFDKDWTVRQCELYILELIKSGKIYDNLPRWESEYEGDAGKFIRIRQRRPSVIYKIPKIVVNESVSMLFGEEHFPKVECDDPKTQEFIEYVTKCAKIKYKMLEAARIGSLGSVCIVVKVLNKRFHLDVFNTITLTPYFDPMCPDKLMKLIDKRKLSGARLMSMGYTGINKDDKNKMFYRIIEINSTEEKYYSPYLCDKEDEDYTPVIDKDRTTKHDLGFVPAIWIKNTATDTNIDGLCTFCDIVDICIEIDYQLSQLGRLLKYNSDPIMVIKDVSKIEGHEIMKGQGALELGPEGDAWMLEMTSGSTSAVIDYVKQLREFALEVIRGNRANPDKMHAINSGKALQMLNSALLSLVDELRLTYGDHGLVTLYGMILDICKSGKYELDLKGYEPNLKFEHEGELILNWGEWYPPSQQDNLQEAQTLQTLNGSGLMSIENAVKQISDKYNTPNVEEELNKIKDDAKLDQSPKTQSRDATDSKGVDHQQE